MTVFTDYKRTVSIELKNWDEDQHQYSPDWSADFYDVGGLTDLNEIQTPCDFPFDDFLNANGYSCDEAIYEVEDVDYLIDYAQDMIDGTGDFDTPSPDVHLFVTDLPTPTGLERSGSAS